VDALFGYDFFISYAWADGKTYAHDLAQRLTRRGFECFLDNRDYSLGDDWKVIGAWALKRTSKLVLVGTSRALQSEPVLLELQVFTSGGKRIIPIDFDGSLASEKNPDNPVLKLVGPTKLKVSERAERLNDGPSDTAVREIVATFNHTRQSVKRLRWIRRVAVLLLALFLVAVGFAFYANQQRKEARRQQSKAEASANEAHKQESKAKASAREATMRQLTAESRLALERGVLDRSLLLAAASFRTKASPEGEGALLNAVAATSSLKAIIRGLRAEVREISLHSNGRWIAVLYQSGAVDIWDVLSGSLVAQPLSEGEADQGSIAFTADGRTLVIGSLDGRIYAWDTETRVVRKLPPNDRETQFLAFALSVDGGVAVLGGNETVAFQDLKTGDFLSDNVSAHKSSDFHNFVNSLATSSDGKYALSGAEDGGIVLWDLRTRSPRGSAMRSNNHSIRELQFLPDNKSFISLNDYGETVIWDITKRKPLRRYSQQVELLSMLGLSLDGRTLVSVDKRNSMRILDSLTGDVIGQVTVRDGSAFAITNDRKTLVTASLETGLLVWDMAEPEFFRREVAKLEEECRYSVSQTGKLAWATKSGKIEILDLFSSKRLQLPDLGHGPSTALAIDSGGTRLVSVDARAGLTFVDLSTRLHVTPGRKEHLVDVSSVEFRPKHSDRVMSIDENGLGILWNAASGAPVTIINPEAKEHPSPGVLTRLPPDFQFSPDGKYLGFASGGALTVYDAESGIKLWGPTPLYANRISSYEFSPDGSHVATIGDGAVIHVLNAQDGVSQSSFSTGQPGEIFPLALSPGGTLLASSSDNGTVCFWDTRTGMRIGQASAAHSGAVWRLAFSADGSRLVSGGHDGRVVLWDPPTGNAIGRSPALHSSKVNFVDFLPDGRRAVSVDEDGLRLVIWDSMSGSAIGLPLEVRSSPSANTPSVFMFGDRVVTIDDDRRVVIWELATSVWLARVSGLVKETRADRGSGQQ
jgi:WD40 repeat protein